MQEEVLNIFNNNTETKEAVSRIEINNAINKLEINSDNPRLLTEAYTDILLNDNVVYLLTRISQNSIFIKHFPEFYEHKKTRNSYGEIEISPESVINCQQNSKYHKYGVFKHILHTIEYVGRDNLKLSKNDLKLLKWTMLLHDIGKPFVKSINENGSESFEGHDEMSYELSKEILDRFYFTKEEKEIILTLIKYHDKYLNVGEITYDNLSFLAHQLKDREDLFELLIEVKIADNKSKSQESEQTFMRNVERYREFATQYFAAKSNISSTQGDLIVGMDDTLVLDTSGETIIKPQEKVNIQTINKKTDNDVVHTNTREREIGEEEFERLYVDITEGNSINYAYKVVADMKNTKVDGYKIQVTFDNRENYTMQEIKKVAKLAKKYNKVNQLSFINALEKIDTNKLPKEQMQYLAVDIEAFEKYNNKQRIYDVFAKNNIGMEIENYENMSVSEFNELQKEVQRQHGNIIVSHIETSKFTLDDIEALKVSGIKYTLTDKMKNAQNGINEETLQYLSEIAEICFEREIKFIIDEVNTKKEMKQLYDKKIFLISGLYLGEIKTEFDITDYDIKLLIDAQ